ncbi:MAG TPA: hypothetical protein VHT72_02605 [Puia sp.]|nr:hypothetical protein [Puia sp.]
MKHKIWLSGQILYSLFLAFLFTGCMKDKITRTYKISTPIYEVLTKFREAIKSQPAMDIGVAGKITVDGNYIYLSEPYKGIHVIDNSNPSSPKNVSYINIPGNEDMAITGKTLYADAYGDLVTFDISNPLDVVAKNFATNVFPDHSIYYYATGINTGAVMNPDSINVIIGYTTRDTTVDYNPSEVYPVYSGCPSCSFLATPSSAAPAAAVPNKTATNGSTARFSIINKFLYTVGYSMLTTFDISNTFAPAQTGTVQVDPHVETIYPLKNRLFVGSNNGMFMYDVQSAPSTPALIGQFTHVRGCDPVIADDNYAYVTLNDSSACLGSANELQIIDIHDVSNATEIKFYQLTHPVGLSKDGNILFVCDGKDGLKIYNADDVKNLQLIKQLNDATDYDVVAQNGIAIVVASNGIYEYDYSDLTNIHLLGRL